MWPCMRGMGGRVTYIAPDWSEIRVRLRLKLRTRNYVGTIFGGSLYGSVIGAVLLAVLPEALRDLGHWRMIAVGVVLFAAILFLPKGLVGEVSAIRLARRQLGRGHW